MNNLIKTAYLVEDREEIEKVNKNIEEREKKINKLLEEEANGKIKGFKWRI